MEKVCKRSGLKFDGTARQLVHPGIRFYTTHTDIEFRNLACQVIERGKSEGWATLEQFKEAISDGDAAVTEAKKEHIESLERYNARGKWAARITGRCAQYDYAREFLQPIETGSDRFLFPVPGIYEVEKAGVRRFYEKTNEGEIVSVDPGRIEAVFGPRPAPVGDFDRPIRNWHDAMCQEGDKVMEECWECGAQFRVVGYVESGRMGCARCN